MDVTSYIFQSPYPQAVQFGRPDPVAQAQQKQQENSERLTTIGNDTQREAQQFQYAATSQTGSSVNVAASTSNSGVAASLEAFASVNTQVQAADAYTE